MFCRKTNMPVQVFAAADAIIKATKTEIFSLIDHHIKEQSPNSTQQPPSDTQVQDTEFPARNVIFSDAAWEKQGDSTTSQAGLGVIIHFQENEHLRQLQVSALSPPVSSPLHAETYGLLLATKLADLLQVQDPRFYTDSAVLVSAAKTASVFATQGNWEIRPELAAIRSSHSFRCNNISHINRSRNIKAHHHARLALRIQTTSLAVRCLSDDTRNCPSRDVLSVSSVTPFTLLSVKCS
jgi:ribonuclease HI